MFPARMWINTLWHIHTMENFVNAVGRKYTDNTYHTNHRKRERQTDRQIDR